MNIVTHRYAWLPLVSWTISHGTAKIVIPEPMDPVVLAIRRRRIRLSRSRSFIPNGQGALSARKWKAETCQETGQPLFISG